MKRLRWLALVLVAFAVTVGAAPAGAAVVGEQRVLLVPVTWGPEPWTRELMRGELDTAAAYVRTSSYGKTWIVGDVTPWLRALPLRPQACDVEAIRRAADAAATRAGYDLGRYTKVAYAFPRIGCPWSGLYNGLIFANGRLDWPLLSHELGHSYGTQEEGGAWICDPSCRSVNYATPFSVMGHGRGDFGAFEKFTYGWLDRVERAPGAATWTLGAIDRPTTDVQAVQIFAAGEEYWLEYRSPFPTWPTRDGAAAPGVAVYAGPNGFDWLPSRYPVRNLLIADPVGRGRPTVQPGETFRAARTFELTVEAADAERATVRFRWIDTSRPSLPRLVSPRARVRGGVTVGWMHARDVGSGIDRYEVSLDGRRRSVVPAVQHLGTLTATSVPELWLGRLRPGRHRVSVLAVDRAGNRSAAATRRFVVSR